MDGGLPNVIKKLIADSGFALRNSTSATLFCATCKSTVSFQTLSSFYDACKKAAAAASSNVDVLLSTDGSDLVVTVRIGKKRARERDGEDGNTGKISNEALRDRVRAAVDKLKKAAGDSVSKQEIEAAQSVCESTVCLLLSVDEGGERAVQSFGTFYKKLAPTDSKPRIVLGFRIHAGLPFKLGDLKSCLAGCWSDGAITTEDTLNSVDSMNLPLTPEGILSREHGNRPLLIVTSVNP